jgi:hypothetical protein
VLVHDQAYELASSDDERLGSERSAAGAGPARVERFWQRFDRESVPRRAILDGGGPVTSTEAVLSSTAGV